MDVETSADGKAKSILAARQVVEQRLGPLLTM